jgi:three-Cys-motif partner protein
MREIKSAFMEPSKPWGGSWTERKLDAFAKYVSAYLHIMKKNPYWKTIYFDGFAGSGDRRDKCRSALYDQLFLSESEEKLYKGAAERVLSLPDDLSFDFYYFIDSNEDSLAKLKLKLVHFQGQKLNKFQFKPGDCNKYLNELSLAMSKRKYASLVLLDPFGMQVNWESIEALKGTRTDIWILIPTGVIVNRLLDKAGELKHLEKLQLFFGIEEDKIIKYFYETEKQNTLFGEAEIIRKVSRPIEKIAELYIMKLGTVWKYVTEKPLVLYNSREVPIYHFVFASNNKDAVKIAKQIIEAI